MAEQKVRGEQANVGRRERSLVQGADRRTGADVRPSAEMDNEVAQRGNATDAHEPDDVKSSMPEPEQSRETPLSGYGNRDDLENPETGGGGKGEGISQHLPGQGMRAPRADSQNGARVADFEDRPSR